MKTKVSKYSDGSWRCQSWFPFDPVLKSGGGVLTSYFATWREAFDYARFRVELARRTKAVKAEVPA